MNNFVYNICNGHYSLAQCVSSLLNPYLYCFIPDMDSPLLYQQSEKGIQNNEKVVNVSGEVIFKAVTAPRKPKRGKGRNILEKERSQEEEEDKSGISRTMSVGSSINCAPKLVLCCFSRPYYFRKNCAQYQKLRKVSNGPG